MSELENSIENCDQSEQLELEGLIESTLPNFNHSGGASASVDLPTPPYGHPSEEGIYMRKLVVEG